MEKNTQIAVEQLEYAIKRYQELTRYHSFDEFSTNDDLHEIFTSMVTTIERFAPKGSFYITNLNNILEHYKFLQAVPSIYGICRALTEAYKQGYFQNIEEHIHADMFSDFMDMAKYLLDEGAFKDPAAVLIGGVLEEHLRKLCAKYSIPTEIDEHPKKADLMNAELAKCDAYSKLDQKNITAWLDLRNKAAHAKWSEYSKEQVDILHLGVREFISRCPA